MEIAVVGLGHVGLPLSCVLADRGFKVIGIDVDEVKVRSINDGVSPLKGEEPGLERLLSKMVHEGHLKAYTGTSLIGEAEGIFVCVDTPMGEDHRPDLTSLRRAVSSIGDHLVKDTLVSVESTIPPLTMTGMVVPTLEERSGLRAGEDFSLVHCPERVMPGRLLYNIQNYERILGGLDERSRMKGMDLYSRFLNVKIHPTDLISAEITKTVENAYRDVQIAFANEVALACEELGADAYRIRGLVNTCPFRDMHLPGSGVGGHCIPKDPWLLMSSVSRELDLLPSARRVNDGMPDHLASLAEEALSQAGMPLDRARVTLFGLGFLRDSGDVRNSPAMRVIDLLEGRCRLEVHDPFVEEGYKVPLTRDLKEALEGSDCAVFVTDHSLYSELDLGEMRDLMGTPIIVDGRNIFRAEECRRAGFVYRGIGKAHSD
ncbi:MAG: nucleotide sugar dehydrogenase [Methanomassiliicoccales archaeon]